MRYRKVGAIITGPEGKFLLRSTKRNPRKWALFGGRVGEGESPKEALIKKTLEENGILLQGIEFFDRVQREDTEQHIFRARLEDELDNRCLRKGENAKFFDRGELKATELESDTRAVFRRFLEKR